MMRLATLLAAMALAIAVPAAHAAESKAAPDELVERRLNAISEELRCLVCQNESLAGSRADLAIDLRREIRTLIEQGRSDREITEFMVARYGDFVLYRPPLKATTILLWVGPFLIVLIGLAALFRNLQRRRADDPTLTEDDRKKAAALLTGKDA